MSKGERIECNIEDGDLVCRKTREVGGKKIIMGEVRKGVDANCNPLTKHISGDERTMEQLSSIADKRVKINCEVKNKPSDY